MYKRLDDQPTINNNSFTTMASPLISMNAQTQNVLDIVKMDNPSNVTTTVNTARTCPNPEASISLPIQKLAVLPMQKQSLAFVQKTFHSTGTIGGTEVSNNHQFAVPILHQSKVMASTSLPQATKNCNISSPVTHQPVTNSQTQFQVLEVGDALSYIDQFKFKFADQPEVYRDFLNIMKDFKSRNINTQEVIKRVSNLLHGDPQMIAGFNAFLPPEYQIGVQSNKQIKMPVLSESSQTSDSSGIMNRPLLPGENLNGHISHSFHHSEPHLVSCTSHCSSSVFDRQSRLQTPVAIDQAQFSRNHLSYHQNSSSCMQSSDAISSSNSNAAENNKPVKFNAFAYVKKIKNRLQDEPSKYNIFLSIIHRYEKELRNLGDEIFIETRARTGSEVYADIAALFKDHPDLLEELGLFLPDADIARNSLCNLQSTNPTCSDYHPPFKFQKSSPKVTPLLTDNEIKQAEVTECSSSTFPSQSVRTSCMTKTAFDKNEKIVKQGITSFKNVAIAETEKHDFSGFCSTHTHSNGVTQDMHIPNCNSHYSQSPGYDGAKDYVNKIKVCFHDEPMKYKEFLEILHDYQRSLKEGNASGTKYLTGDEVYNKVAKLLNDKKALLLEFVQFMPNTNDLVNSMLVDSQPHQPETLVHDSSSKKQNASIKCMPLLGNSGIKQKKAVRFASALPSRSLKKTKNVNLKSITLEEAMKCVTSTELSFFDEVRRQMDDNSYKNFLRFLSLYNEHILSKKELLRLVTPSLIKYPMLYQWFDNFLQCSVQRHNVESSQNKAQYQELNQVAAEFTVDCDYLSLKQCGASYREIPGNYAQPRCSGRLDLDNEIKEVLNDKYVSIPLWSDDSICTTLRKTQYEEYVYKCEDERSELDILLETNLSTIRFLERAKKTLDRISLDPNIELRLDDALEETLSVLHEQPIKRIYGRKAMDIIEGLRKNPLVTIPVVLKRLKEKNAEWQTARKGFNKIWKEQNEKYFLKSLDHQSATFKQNDMKSLKPKNILYEIETICKNRHKQYNFDDVDVSVDPHVVGIYKDQARVKDAASLIIHCIEKQVETSKDKKTMKILIRKFIPDLFSFPSLELCDDKSDQDFSLESEDVNDSWQIHSDFERLGLKSSSECLHQSILKRERKCDKCDKFHAKCKVSQLHDAENCIHDSYNLIFVNNEWYIFFHLHHVLYERLEMMYEHSQNILTAEIREREKRKPSTILALKHKPKNINVENYYPIFLDILKDLVDSNIENNQYEDTLREMFGIHAYIAFTLDKVIQNVMRQLQHIVSDEASRQCVNLYFKNKNTGKGITHETFSHSVRENVYQKTFKNMLGDENCFEIVFYKDESKLAIRLLLNKIDSPEDRCILPEEYIRENSNSADEEC